MYNTLYDVHFDKNLLKRITDLCVNLKKNFTVADFDQRLIQNYVSQNYFFFAEIAKFYSSGIVAEFPLPTPSPDVDS